MVVIEPPQTSRHGVPSLWGPRLPPSPTKTHLPSNIKILNLQFLKMNIDLHKRTTCILKRHNVLHFVPVMYPHNWYNCMNWTYNWCAVSFLAPVHLHSLIFGGYTTPWESSFISCSGARVIIPDAWYYYTHSALWKRKRTKHNMNSVLSIDAVSIE